MAVGFLFYLEELPMELSIYVNIPTVLQCQSTFICYVPFRPLECPDVTKQARSWGTSQQPGGQMDSLTKE